MSWRPHSDVQAFEGLAGDAGDDVEVLVQMQDGQASACPLILMFVYIDRPPYLLACSATGKT